MSIHSVLTRGVAQIRNLGMGDQLIQQLGRESFFIGSLSQLEDAASMGRLGAEDRRMVQGIVSALEHAAGPGIPEDTAPSGHYVTTERPVRLGDGAYFARGRFRLFEPGWETGGITVVRAETPRFLPPPSIPLNTDHYLDVLQLLEYAGVHYADPRSPAAGLGFSAFQAGRHYVRGRLERLKGTGRSEDWIGFDWDFTTDVYRIYAELGPLISMKLFHEPPANAGRKFIRVLETAKPGLHEIILGMMTGYALDQGIAVFNQWENYFPRLRVVTQTWPQRLAELGRSHVRLVPLLMGRLPGLKLEDADVINSRACITLQDFLREAGYLLDTFREAGFRFEGLEPEEREDLIAILRTGKGHVIKSMGAFEARGWSRPSLVFDDGPVTNRRLEQAGVRVVPIPNPLSPGREMSDLKVVTLLGRRAAARQLLRMVTRSEAEPLVGLLGDLLQGVEPKSLSTDLLPRTPIGTVVTIHDTRRSLDLFFEEFERPKREMKRRIRAAIRAAGGMGAVERDYREAVSVCALPPASP
jgi:hypothetical protein